MESRLAVRMEGLTEKRQEGNFPSDENIPCRVRVTGCVYLSNSLVCSVRACACARAHTHTHTHCKFITIKINFSGSFWISLQI